MGKAEPDRPVVVPNSGISPEVGALLEARSSAFSAGTQRKGLPMIYGHGKEPPKRGKR